MTGSDFSASVTRNDRQIIRVRAPTAQAAIGEALRRAFVMPVSTNCDRELSNLLERL